MLMRFNISTNFKRSSQEKCRNSFTYFQIVIHLNRNFLLIKNKIRYSEHPYFVLIFI